MPPKLQIQIVQDGQITEIWTYIPEWNAWRDIGGEVRLSTDEVVNEDLPLAIRHAMSLIDGTHS